MVYFATLFDINYLSRGLALLSSLKEHSSAPFRLFILALDEEAASYFEKNPDKHVCIIPLNNLLDHFPELQEAKKNRSKVEFYFTLSPYLPLYIFDRYDQVNQVTTMDADIYFFNDPAIILNKYPDADVLITPHNLSIELKHLEIYGRYNVSFQSFKNNDIGRLCLNKWRNDCFEWCHDYYDAASNRFADQKYLDTWHETFAGVMDIDIPGAGLAPWNIENYQYTSINGQIMVDRHPLIYYHFHHLRIFNKNFAFNGLEEFKVETKRKAIKQIYHIYLKKLRQFETGQLNTGSHTLRYDSFSTNNLKHNLKNREGYWFFTNNMITHINLQRRYSKLKHILKSLWPS